MYTGCVMLYRTNKVRFAFGLITLIVITCMLHYADDYCDIWVLYMYFYELYEQKYDQLPGMRYFSHF